MSSRIDRKYRIGALAGLAAAMLTGVTALAITAFGEGPASAYVGTSLMDIPGISGTWQGPTYKNWLRIEASYWEGGAPAGRGGGQARAAAGGAQGAQSAGANTQNAAAAGGGQARAQGQAQGQGQAQVQGGAFGRGRPAMYSGPTAPRSGAAKLVISIDKHNPALAAMMAKCAVKAVIPELKFAELSFLSRGLGEKGPKPAAIPDFFEYKIKNIEVSDCPVVDGAPEQAIVLSFQDIEWLNYQGNGEAVAMTPAVLAPVKASTGETKSFVVSWFAVANDVSDNQCPNINKKPVESDYYALMSKEEAEKERADFIARKTDINYENGQMGHRGAHKLNAAMLPGIVKDPGHFLVQSKIARGINLDGDDGKGAPPGGICRHRNYMSDDGRTGIDNQIFTVQGCMPGYQGHKGFLMQYRNEQRRNGLLSIVVQISGIDNEKNDNDVDVTIVYSKDPMAKNADGSKILADYTYRLSDNQEYTHYFSRLHGRIVNGVIVTDPVKLFQMHLGIDPELNLYNARMRLQIMPDGSLKGVVGGYEDWRKVMALNTNSNSEQLYGFQAPGFYNALKREADGLKDPVTGQCNGISIAYDIEGSPAFIPPGQAKMLMAQATVAKTPR